MRKRFLSLCLCVLLCAGLCVSLASCNGKTTVLKVGKTSFSKGEYAVAFAITYSNFLTSYDTSSLGFDTSVDPRKQTCAIIPSMTWAQYLMQSTADFCRELCIVTDEAKRHGVALTDAEKQSVRTEVYGTENEPVDLAVWNTLYGDDVSAEDVVSVMQSIALYRKYYEKLVESFGITEEEISAYGERNRATLDGYTVRIVPFDYSSGTMSASDAKKEAKAFCEAVTSEKEITERARLVLSKEMLDYFGATDFTLTYNASPDMFGENTAVSRWMTSEKRAYMDSFVYDNGSVVLALFFIGKDTKEYATVNIRHILCEDASAASEAYDAWTHGAKTEDTFVALVSEYSKDSATSMTGGLYEHLAKGDVDNVLTAWMFDPDRVHNDACVLTSSYGTHVVYFVSTDGETYRHRLCRTALEASRYKAFLRGYDGYETSYKEENLTFVFE